MLAGIMVEAGKVYKKTKSIAVIATLPHFTKNLQRIVILLQDCSAGVTSVQLLSVWYLVYFP